MQNTGRGRFFGENPIIDFQGVIVAISRNEDTSQACLVVCSVAKDRRKVKPIMLELHFSSSLSGEVADAECGMLVQGRGQLGYLEDGFFVFRDPEIPRFLPINSPHGFDGLPWKSRHFSGLARIIIREAMKEARFLDGTLLWKFLSPYIRCRAFECLVAGAFAGREVTLVYMSCAAMTIKSMRREYAMIRRKYQYTYLCLLGGMQTRQPLPPFLAIGSFNNFPRIYEATGNGCYFMAWK